MGCLRRRNKSADEGTEVIELAPVDVEVVLNEGRAKTVAKPAVKAKRRFRCHWLHCCCQWFCTLMTPRCKCFCCIFIMMATIILLMYLIILYLQWRVKVSKTVWSGLVDGIVSMFG